MYDLAGLLLLTPATMLVSFSAIHHQFPSFLQTHHHRSHPSQPKTKSHTSPLYTQTLSSKPTNFTSISLSYIESTTHSFTSPYSSDSEDERKEYEQVTSSFNVGIPPPVLKKRKRYRKEYPGESKGITEEMRFVAMKLRNDNGEKQKQEGDDGSWEPSIEGFVKYLVDSKLVFQTVEKVVEDSNDVSYAYFRKTGLERSESLARDIEWFGQQDIVIPEPSNAGISYATYLKELEEKSAQLFLSHFYNVYFSHIAGGQVIAKQVSEKLLQGRVLEFYRWEGEEAEELLEEVREKLNKLSEHWSRDDKNKCLKETTKSFRYLGQIVRLIIL